MRDKCYFCDGEMEEYEVKTLIRCSDCGIYRDTNTLTKEQVKGKLKDFLLSASRTPEKEQKRLERADYQLDFLEKYSDKGNVYDVGAASGFFMKRAQDRGWTVGGNEVSKAAILWGKEHYGIDIDYGFLLEDIEVPYDYFQAVVLWNSLEHVTNPAKLIEKCHKMLKEGGYIFIEVPIKRNKHELLKFYEGPSHTHEFNREGLLSFLGKYFEEVEIREYEVNSLLHFDVLFRKK